MPISDPPRRVALLVASAGYFFVLLDVTIVNVALPDIGGQLGARRSDLQWVVDAYALVLACEMLSAGDLADRFGSRQTFCAGLAAFALASAGCALAPAIGWLIGARTLQGLAAAAILPASLALVNELYPDPAERPRAIGLWAGLGGSALLAGPILGGLLVNWFGWPAIFWLNVPLALAALALAPAVLPAPDRSSGRRLDLAGQLVGTVAVSAVVVALVEGGREGFGAPPTILAALVAILALPAFVMLESRRDHPMLDPRWFRRAEFSAANLGAGLMNLGTLGALFAISLFLQGEMGRSALETGVALIPLAAPLALLTPLSGQLVAEVGARAPAGLGLLLCGIAYSGISLSGSDVTDLGGVLLLALAGIGMAIAVPGLVAGATEALGERRAGIASAINNTSRQLGGAIGVALIGGVASFGAALAISGGSLLLGAGVALALMARSS